MGGSSSIRGDQTIYHTDNMCFDGTDRGSPMSLDGQLWIGSTTSNRPDNGGHVRLGELTSPDSSVTIGYSAPNITLSSGSKDLHVASFIVNPNGPYNATGSNFQTISAAIASVQGTGQHGTIFLMPGTYTENISITDGINISAFVCDSTTPNVTINGKITMSTAGTCSISGVRLQTNSDYFLEVTTAGISIVYLENCYLNITNNSGIHFTSNNASSQILIDKCRGNITASGNAIFVSTSAGAIGFTYCQFGNPGSSSTASTISAGSVSISYCLFTNPITSSGTASMGIGDTVMAFSSLNTTCVTCGGSGTHDISRTQFASGTATSISISGALNLRFSTISSSNASAISGAGTLTYGDLTFSSTSSTISTTTQVPLIRSNTAVKVVTPGAYPYTTVPQDELILVDSSAARTITPLASPTTGQKHIIKDNAGSAAANNITITPSGKNVDGAASTVINVNYGSVTIIYNGTQWNVV